ncbi:MAG TPA: S41 family peptidase [Planctomycetota bacterium]|nr:S41 family peptidase [Planctomycetota bacterium]
MTRVPAAIAFSFVAVLLGSGLLLPAQETQDRVDKIFDRIEESRGAGLWQGIRELEDLGRGATDGVRKGLTRADAYVRIAAAKVLYAQELRDESLDALSKVMAGKNTYAKKTAADMAAALVSADRSLAGAEKQKIAASFERQAGEVDDPLTQIALWRAVYNLNKGMKPVREVRAVHSGAGDKREVKEEAALALAEMDRFVDAKPTLIELAKEPSERGRMAKAYLKVNELTEDINRKPPAAVKYDFKTLEEAIDLLKQNYWDESKINVDKLVENAVRGACSSLDPYTVYMDEAAIKELKEEGLGGRYGGIGARVSMRKDKAGREWLTIEEPIFSGPAYRNGLRSGDTITEIDGEATVNQDLTSLVKKLRGQVNTPAKFKVLRRGWTKEQPYSIQREQIHMETTMHRMLPGNLGYIRLTTFGDEDIQYIKDSVNDMKDMKALVFDLRGNTGGYLRTANALASYFLNKGQLIVTTRARGEEKDRRVADGSKLTDVPMVMLVNEGSASASEILAGAMQDHKRAVIIGDKTYGKGSVQDLKPMKTTEDKAAVKITIAKWFLPSGKSVEKDKREESGVVPDIKVALPEREFWKEAELAKLMTGDEIEKYLKDIEDKELFKKLAESDGGDVTRYPKFDAFYEGLKTKAEKNDVRELVREMIRKKVQDEQGKPLYVDLQVDVVLQRGILEACKAASIDAKTVKEYSLFAKAPPTTDK